jgi:hypothetical protein
MVIPYITFMSFHARIGVIACLCCALHLAARGEPGWTQFVNCSQVTSSCLAGNSLWLSTNAGIVRFDTVRGALELFSNCNANIGSNPRSLCTGQNGDLWTATDRGLSKFSGGAWRFESGAGRPPTGSMLSVAATHTGHVYASGSYGGLCFFDGNAWLDFLEAHPGFPFPLAQGGATVFVSDTVLFVKYAELYYAGKIVGFSQGAWRTLSQNGVMAAAADNYGGIWFTQGQESPVVELVHINDTGFRKFNQPNSTNYNLRADQSGRLYRWGNYSPSHSLFRESDSTWISGVDPDTATVAKLPLSSLTIDPAGTLWGTFKAPNNSGVLTICALAPGGSWRQRANLPPPVMPFSSVIRIVEGANDSIWALERYYGTLAVWDGTIWNKSLLLSSPDVPNELTFDDNGELWLTTGRGTICHRSGSQVCVAELRLPLDSIRFPLVKIARGRDKRLWALGVRADNGGSGSGTMVYLFRLESGAWKPLPDSLRLPFSSTNLSFVRLSFDAGPESWIKIGDSLYTHTEQTGWRSESDLFRKFGISSVANALVGREHIWIGGQEKGIIRVGAVDTILIQPPGTISAAGIATPIIVDTSGALWCSFRQRSATSSQYYYAGIARLDKTGWRTLDSRSSGIPSEAVNDIIFDKKGRIWVATDNGIAMCDLKNLSVRRPAPNPGNRTASFPGNAVDIQIRRGALAVRTSMLDPCAIAAYDIAGRCLASMKIQSGCFSIVPLPHAPAARAVIVCVRGIDRSGRDAAVRKTVCLR